MSKQAKPATETLANGATILRVEQSAPKAKTDKAAKPQGKANTKAKGEAKAKTEAKGAPLATLKAGEKAYVFNLAPAGNILRAYFIALIQAQAGGIVADKPFTLWPGNFGGHVASGRMVKKFGAVYTLTTAGVNYFNDPEQAADPSMLADMAQAVRTGVPPAFYKRDMRAIEV